MAAANKVTWLEGMFLRHQHFQEQDRHTEQSIASLVDVARDYSWGFTHLALDQQHLALGRVAVSEAKGVFADGTIFDTTQNCDPPSLFDVPQDLRNSQLYLAIPLRGADLLETASENSINLARFFAKEVDVRDATNAEQEPVSIYVSRLHLRIVSDKDDLSQYATLPIARVIEKRTDGSVLLDAKFIPTCLNIKVSPVLSAFLQELQGLLHHRAEDLAVRVARPNANAISSVMDFLLLQLINRYELYFQELSHLKRLHPHVFYLELLKLYGEVATFTRQNKRPLLDLPGYRQDQLITTYAPLINELRECLSVMLEQSAIPLKLQLGQQGIRAALIKERELLNHSRFILAVKAELPINTLRKQFPAQTKIAPVEKIRGLINIQLPGITLNELAVAPPEIPYHQGFLYFELDKTGQFWKHMETSSGFAFHISGEFPGLELEFWAVKGD